jgi:hypothetical protein
VPGRTAHREQNIHRALRRNDGELPTHRQLSTVCREFLIPLSWCWAGHDA